MKINRKNSARLLVLCAATALMFAAGCREDMQDEPKMIPQRGTTMFADGRSARPQVAHTIARGEPPMPRVDLRLARLLGRSYGLTLRWYVRRGRGGGHLALLRVGGGGIATPR